MRALWYFIRQAQARVLLALAGGFAMAVYIWFIQDVSFSVQKLLCICLLYTSDAADER